MSVEIFDDPESNLKAKAVQNPQLSCITAILNTSNQIPVNDPKQYTPDSDRKSTVFTWRLSVNRVYIDTS